MTPRSLPPAAAFPAIAIGLLLTAAATVFSDTPAQTSNLIVLTFGLSLVAAGAFGVVDHRHLMSPSSRNAGVVGLIALTAMFAVGFVTQENVDGRPVLDLSNEGATIREFNRIADDFEIARQIDIALTHDPVVLRAKGSGVARLISDADSKAANLASSSHETLSDLQQQTAEALTAASIALQTAHEAAVQSQDGRSDAADRAAEAFVAAMEATKSAFAETVKSTGYTGRDWMQETS